MYTALFCNAKQKLLGSRERKDWFTTKQFIIYGAGKTGKTVYALLNSYKKAALVYGFCDRAYQEMGPVEGKQVFSYEDVKNIGLPFLLGISGEAGHEVRTMLEADGQEILCFDSLAAIIGIDLPTFEREYVAKFHISEMDEYFVAAEGEESLQLFWGEKSPFLRMFQQLDLSHVIELACGRGRHVSKYIDQAGDVTLVDILQKNIDFCQNRFVDQKNIFYYCNNGYNLEKLESGCYSALFSYDAMVHFEMMDIFSYLKDIRRVLSAGGCALIHHSNNDSDYKAAFDNAPGGRSFMSQKIFAYLAYRAGLEVVEQQVIDWGKKDLDCITLLRKNS